MFVTNIFFYDEQFYIPEPAYALLNSEELFSLVEQAKLFLSGQTPLGWKVTLSRRLNKAAVITGKYFKELEDVDCLEISEKTYQDLLKYQHHGVHINLEMTSPHYYTLKVFYTSTLDEIGEAIPAFQEEK